MLFVVVDVGQPARLANLFLHPSPRSLLFWDTVALSGYLLLNLAVGWSCLEAERVGEKPHRLIRALAILSIPWAVSIHTVTAFLFCGLPARPFWFTAILAPRFLASAFAAGPALLLVLCLLVRRFTGFDPGQRAIRILSHVVAWAMALNLFLFGVEIFTSLYSASEHHLAPLRHLYLPSPGTTPPIVPFMYLGLALGLAGMALLAIPRTRRHTPTLALGCGLVFVSIWIDKGAGLLTGGLNPDPLGCPVPYFPSWVEIAMGLSLYAFGALLLTVLYRIAIVTKLQAQADH
jgi:molybdopterin-containing oxidoreductase family membrane subunit